MTRILQKVSSKKDLKNEIKRAQEFIYREFWEGYKTGNLESVAERFGFVVKSDYESRRMVERNKRKILVLGNVLIDELTIEKVCKRLKIPRQSIDFIGYEDVKNFNLERIRNSEKYTDLILGPLPHSTKKCGASGIINTIENNIDEFPYTQINRSDDTNELKGITKGDFVEILKNTFYYKNSNPS